MLNNRQNNYGNNSIVFFNGIVYNFYSHMLYSHLREKGRDG